MRALAFRGLGRGYGGYALVILSYVLMGATAALVDMTTAPNSVVLCARMALAALVLAAVFARRATIADWRRAGAAPRLLLMGVISSATLLLYFFAIRSTSVAIAMILLFMMPVWVALIAPRIFHTARDRIVLPALAVALLGLCVILSPELFGGNVEVSAWGVLAGLAAGLGYAVYALLVKGLTKLVASATVSLAEAGLAALFTLPLAVWQFAETSYHPTLRDVVLTAIMGVVCTAFAYTIWVEATRFVRVEHVTMLGYMEPVAAPIYALVLLGQRPSVWTMLGGALVIAAGVLIVGFGRPEGEAPATTVAEPEPL